MFDIITVLASTRQNRLFGSFVSKLWRIKKPVRGLYLMLCLFFLLPIGHLQGQNCNSDGYQQFNFWIGTWEVYRPGTDTLLGRNEIKKTAKGCALLEDWTGRSGFRGQSMNTYDPVTDSWRQRWVDQTGQVIDFKGKSTSDGMVFRAFGLSGRDSLFHLMTYHYNFDTTEVLQTWKQKRSSTEKEWSVVFQGQYKKEKK